MISREEALKELEENVYYVDDIKTIYRIYDSIGSCGECKHYSLLDGACKLHSEDTSAIVTMMNHDFCSYFERR